MGDRRAARPGIWEQGLSATWMLVMFQVFLLVIAGVVDGGSWVRAVRQAHFAARTAAFAGAMQLDEAVFIQSGVVLLDSKATYEIFRIATQNARAETGGGLDGPYTQMAVVTDVDISGDTVTVTMQPTPRFLFIGRLVGTEGWFQIPVVRERAQLQYGITGVENP
jgi:hypothetical protein